MKVRRSFLKDQVAVSTYEGEGSYGPSYADEITVWCNVDETRRLVRDSTGDEVVSEVTLQLHPKTRVVPDDPSAMVGVVDPTVVFTAESQVTVRGRVAKVLTAKPHTIRGQTVMVEVTCG